MSRVLQKDLENFWKNCREWDCNLLLVANLGSTSAHTESVKLQFCKHDGGGCISGATFVDFNLSLSDFPGYASQRRLQE